MNLQMILFLVIFNIYCTQCTPYFMYLAEKEVDKPKKYCGIRLIRAMSVVCKGVYAEKRSRNNDFDYENEYSDKMSSEDFETDIVYPFIYKASGLSLIPKKRETPRGRLIEECCEKPCTHAFMKENYCGNVDEN